MSDRDLKLSIHELLEKTDDSEVLALIYVLLKKLTMKELEEDGVAGYEADGTPVTEEELIESILESSRETRAGNVISHTEMKTLLGIHG